MSVSASTALVEVEQLMRTAFSSRVGQSSLPLRLAAQMGCPERSTGIRSSIAANLSCVSSSGTTVRSE